jgi:hypothetical protein
MDKKDKSGETIVSIIVVIFAVGISRLIGLTDLPEIIKSVFALVIAIIGFSLIVQIWSNYGN